uniref:Uncharacterized protein n=1 Tax=Anguilla anguilla TaxID=7936 RepID=A0A0E9XSQ3_ANGAN
MDKAYLKQPVPYTCATMSGVRETRSPATLASSPVTRTSVPA